MLDRIIRIAARRRELALLFGALIASTTPGAAPADSPEVVFPPGQRIGIAPPPGMALNKSTGRFEDPDRQATLIALDLPGSAYTEMEKMVFAEISGPGVTVEKRENFPFASGLGYLATVRLTIDGAEYKKWILLSASAASPMSDLVAIVSVQVPKPALDAYPDKAVRAALASVTFRPPPIEERLSLLPFKLGDLAGFRVTQVGPLGVVLVDGPEGAPAQSEIAVTAGRDAPQAAEERPAFARHVLLNSPLREPRITAAESIRISGSPGFEIRAAAKDTAGRPVMVVQWLRFVSGGGYMRIVGGARDTDWERVFPRFRALRDSIELR